MCHGSLKGDDYAKIAAMAAAAYFTAGGSLAGEGAAAGAEGAAGAGAAGAAGAGAAGGAAALTAEEEAALGGLDAMQAGGLGGMSVAQNGYGAGSLGAHAMGLLNNPSAVTSMGPITSASGGSSVAGTRLATMMGQGLLGGQQPQQQPQGRPFMPAQQQSAPSTGNAAYAPVQAPQVGMQPKDLERQKLLAQLRAQGYPV